MDFDRVQLLAAVVNALSYGIGVDRRALDRLADVAAAALVGVVATTSSAG
ncbi:hypothetical protein [Streptomyces litmocidini]|nr:hypothetical protein [Streptomyces litmocidini]